MLVVTGMHRSGTSLLTSLLIDAGIEAGPGAMYPSDSHNELGYFEEVDIVNLNSLIVAGTPRVGPTPRAQLAQARYLLGTSDANMGRRARRLSDQILEASKARTTSLTKDPRFMLTLKHWSDQGAQIDGAIVAVRHPNAVANSLKRRNRLPESLARRFWGRHVRAALEVQAVPMCFVDMDSVLGGDASGTIERLSSFLGDRIEAGSLESALKRRLETSLLHSAVPSASETHPAIRALYEELRDRCNS